jgi:hypothetical protein
MILEEHGAIGDVIGFASAIKHDPAAFRNFAENFCER